jgi:hypothetical protein
MLRRTNAWMVVCYQVSVSESTLLNTPINYALWVFFCTIYQIATPGIAAKAESTSIYIEQKFSDHAPLIVNYKGEL